ncbi:prolyl aminopeptidase [Thalassotalea sp. LPB0316]|uniref:prolyl aminopeptidase n=1 Tax=Thalassotalea sp. LPB0316 TaxID=2769490 RepID=UPI001867D3DE|nr:prolyl aminopeptidase [Thalassotalea sp. LPB0316]QOL26012.1 prolyl aminopeptidase [Thalassotalea sp. LPB0316]
MKPLYPKILPNATHFIEVSEQHQIYVESSGNPAGIPVIYCHGGPGAGASSDFRRYFNPEIYHIILFDQRGCGRSLPSPSVEGVDMVSMIADMEKIRQFFTVDKWLVTGGSWGTTLSLAYGQSYPQHCLGFILRGVFLATQVEYDWLYRANGVAKFFPEYYQDFLLPLNEQQKRDPLSAYYQLVTSDNEVAAIAACKAWYLYEDRMSSIEHQADSKQEVDDPHIAHCLAMQSAHFFYHNSFMAEGQLLDNIHRINHLPAFILHGRYDMICQLDIAYQLANAWPTAQLQILPVAGHSGFERQTIDAFCQAADKMAEFIGNH